MTSYVFAENPALIIPVPSLNDTPSAIVIFASTPAVNMVNFISISEPSDLLYLLKSSSVSLKPFYRLYF